MDWHGMVYDEHVHRRSDTAATWICNVERETLGDSQAASYRSRSGSTSRREINVLLNHTPSDAFDAQTLRARTTIDDYFVER